MRRLRQLRAIRHRVARHRGHRARDRGAGDRAPAAARPSAARFAEPERRHGCSMRIGVPEGNQGLRESRRADARVGARAGAPRASRAGRARCGGWHRHRRRALRERGRDGGRHGRRGVRRLRHGRQGQGAPGGRARAAAGPDRCCSPTCISRPIPAQTRDLRRQRRDLHRLRDRDVGVGRPAAARADVRGRRSAGRAGRRALPRGAARRQGRAARRRAGRCAGAGRRARRRRRRDARGRDRARHGRARHRARSQRRRPDPAVDALRSRVADGVLDGRGDRAPCDRCRPGDRRRAGRRAPPRRGWYRER